MSFYYIHPKNSFIIKSKIYFSGISSLQHTKMSNFDETTGEKQIKHNPNCSYIPARSSIQNTEN